MLTFFIFVSCLMVIYYLRPNSNYIEECKNKTQRINEITDYGEN